MRREFLTLLLWASTASAEGDVFGIAARPQTDRSVGAYVGLLSVAATAVRPGPANDWRLTAQWFHADRFAALHATRTAALVDWPTFGLSYQLGTSLLVIPVGGLELGLGAHTALLAGWRFRFVSFAIGPEASVEGFVRPLGVRVPLRLAADARAHVGAFDIGLTGKAGADVDPDFSTTGRYSAGVFVERRI